MRLAVYTDYAYRRDDDGTVYGDRAFVVFVCGLAPYVERLVVIGRLNPNPGISHYPLPRGVGFVGLPHYETLTRADHAIFSMFRSLRRFWRLMDHVDAVWLLGPYVHSLAFVGLAALRRRRIVLGVRQDLPRYTRSRHPHRRLLHWASSSLEACWRALARRYPIVVVGPDLAERYAGGQCVLPIAVSLVRAEDLLEPEEALRRAWNSERRVLSVGRLDREKNPLLLADILAALRACDDRWRLVVCGDGPLRAALEDRLDELGVRAAADVLGYVPVDQGLAEVYRSCHALLHVSWTEGVPQVLFEGFAAGLPVVATAVGGVAAAAGDAALLVEPGNVQQPAQQLGRLADDARLREQLVRAAHARVQQYTLEAQVRRVMSLIATGELPAGAGGPGRRVGRSA